MILVKEGDSMEKKDSLVNVRNESSIKKEKEVN